MSHRVISDVVAAPRTALPSLDLRIIRDYAAAVEWFGWMPLNDFAAGYRAADAWFLAHPRRPSGRTQNARGAAST